MRTPLKLTTFGAGLVALFGAAALTGAAIDPERARDEAQGGVAHGGGSGGHAGEAGGAGAAASEAGAHGGGAAAAETATHGGHDADAVRGLAAAEDGLRLVLDTPELRRGERERVAFRIVGPDGRTVRDFDLTHERRLHLIVVRRDLSGFQHLHPTMGADGTWSTSLTLPEAGSYRLFADFARDGEAATLASDLRVDGAADLRELPAPAPVATSDLGSRVELTAGGKAPHADAERTAGGDTPRAGVEETAAAGTAGRAPVRAGAAQTLRFAISRGGRPVALEPYLGADGHLVALREGDLAFLHVHPSGAGPAFETTFPTAGRYRLFLQYKAGGRVETAAFTQEVRR